MVVNFAPPLVERFLQRQSDVPRRGSDVVHHATARDVVATEVGHRVRGQVIPGKRFAHVLVEVLRHRTAAEGPVPGDFQPLHASPAVPHPDGRGSFANTLATGLRRRRRAMLVKPHKRRLKGSSLAAGTSERGPLEPEPPGARAGSSPLAPGSL
jgi:hypothetical protein